MMATTDVALLFLRMGVGLIFAVHGAQKVFGWWDGPGFDGWTAVMVRLGFKPAPAWAALSAFAELGGGLMLVFGLLTPLAATLAIGQSVVIIGASHWKHGFFNRNNGYEFPLALAAGFAAVLLAGPGAVSLDGVIGFALAPEVRAGLFVLAIVGGLASLALPALLARRQAAPVELRQAH
jgi:putative oxidoreductase